MRMKERSDGAITILEFLENLTGGAQSAVLRKTVEDCVAAGKTQLVFNLKHVKFIASQGVGMIMAAKLSCDAANGRLVTCEPNPRVVSLFNLYHIDQVLDSYEFEEEAVASFHFRSASEG